MKKLSVKTNKKTGKLVIHKNKDVGVAEEDEPPFEPDVEEIEPGEQVQVATEKIVGQEVIGKSHVKPKHGEAVDETEVVAVAQISGPTANVGYNIARTINLGDFESIKISVDIHVPSEVDEDEIEANYEFVKGWCEEKIEAIVKEYTG